MGVYQQDMWVIRTGWLTRDESDALRVRLQEWDAETKSNIQVDMLSDVDYRFFELRLCLDFRLPNYQFEIFVDDYQDALNLRDCLAGFGVMCEKYLSKQARYRTFYA